MYSQLSTYFLPTPIYRIVYVNVEIISLYEKYNIQGADPEEFFVYV